MCTRVHTCINKHFSFKIFLLNLPFEKFLDPCLITAIQIRVYNMLLCFAVFILLQLKKMEGMRLFPITRLYSLSLTSGRTTYRSSPSKGLNSLVPAIKTVVFL